MKMVYIGHGHAISDRDAGRLAREAGIRLPRAGYSVEVRVNGIPVRLARTEIRHGGAAYGLPPSIVRRGWVWYISGPQRYSGGRDPRRRSGSRRRTRRDEFGSPEEFDRLFRSLSRASQDYLHEYTSSPRREEVIAAFRRVPENERRLVARFLEGERPYYERVESEVFSDYYED